MTVEPALVEPNLYDLEIISCSTIRAKFDLFINYGDSTTIERYGVSYTYPGSGSNSRIERDYNGVIYDMVFSNLETFKAYTFTPYVIVNGKRIEGPWHALSTGGNSISLENEELFDLTEANLGFDFLSESTSTRIGNKAYL